MRAITIGVKTILKSKKIFLLAWGERKAGILKKAIEGPVSEKVPASFLQEHPDSRFLLDEAAASKLD